MDKVLAANVLFECLSQAWCIFRKLGDSLTQSQHLTSDRLVATFKYQDSVYSLECNSRSVDFGSNYFNFKALQWN